MSIGDKHGDHDIDWMEARRTIAERNRLPIMQWRIKTRPRIDHSYDIAYLAGISNDGLTVYIDREFPFTAFPVGHLLINDTDQLIRHESWEQVYIDFFKDHYERAHRLATVAEHDLVVSRHIPWNTYKLAYDPFVKKDEHERIRRSPRDLFLRPYEDSGDLATIRRIRETMV